MGRSLKYSETASKYILNGVIPFKEKRELLKERLTKIVKDGESIELKVEMPKDDNPVFRRPSFTRSRSTYGNPLYSIKNAIGGKSHIISLGYFYLSTSKEEILVHEFALIPCNKGDTHFTSNIVIDSLGNIKTFEDGVIKGRLLDLTTSQCENVCQKGEHTI
jgi:hypothetical protein